MASELYRPEDHYIMNGKNGSAWRNADTKLASAGCIAPDEFLGGSLNYPGPRTKYLGKSNSYIRKRKTDRYIVGTYTEKLLLQTARLLYPAFGKCTTTEATPNIHAITKRTSQTPINCYRHIEKINETAGESERLDTLGMLNKNLNMSCSEVGNQIAEQVAQWDFAFYLANADADLIAKKTDLTVAPFEWPDFTFPTFTYNSETIECEVLGWVFNITNKVRPYKLVKTGTKPYFTKGKMQNFQDLSVTLIIEPYGRNIFELVRTKLESYATDLDLVVKMARNATTDYIQFTHDKMYCDPFDIVLLESDADFERYSVTMHQLHTGSLAIEAKDAYDNDHYENP